jgi:hypothetical protein
MTSAPRRYRETAAELREVAEQMRWAESRDYLLRMAEKFSEMAQPKLQEANTSRKGVRSRD